MEEFSHKLFSRNILLVGFYISTYFGYHQITLLLTITLIVLIIYYVYNPISLEKSLDAEYLNNLLDKLDNMNNKINHNTNIKPCSTD